MRLLLLLGAVICVALAFLAYLHVSSSPAGTAGDAALRYARTEMVWTHGPSVLHERAATMGALPALLPRLANVMLRNDVNAADLIRRFGAGRKIDIVVLTGVYNSLPPDEGVDVQGEVLVLLDPSTERLLFLTA